MNLANLILFLLTATMAACKNNLIADFFKLKNLKIGLIFDCFLKKSDHLKAFKYLETQGLRNSVFRINYFNSTKPFLKENSKVSGVIINADCEGATQLLLDIGNLQLYGSTHHWLITSSSRSAADIFGNVNLHIAVNLILAVASNKQNWLLFDVYNPYFAGGAKVRATVIGNYTKDTGFLFNNFEGKYVTRRNMSEVHFKSQIVLPAPFKGSLGEYILSDDDRHINTFSRFHNRLLQHCQDYYGYKLNVSLSNSWGYKKSNGEFDGVMGAIIKGEIDFPVAPLALRLDRLPTITYGRHTWLLRSAFIFRDKKAAVSMKTFFQPLALPVWLVTIISALLLSVMLKLAFRFERILKEKSEASWSYVFLITIATFCQQGSYHSTTLLSARIVVIFSLILSLLIYQFYSGALVSFLLMQTSTTIRTITDIDNSGMNVGCEDILYIHDFFNHNTDKSVQHLYEKHTVMSPNHSIYLPASIGIKLVEKGNYAFDVDLATAYPIIENSFSGQAICELREVPLFVREIFFYVKKWSPLKDMFDTCLHRLAEYGMLHRQLHHWHPRKPVCLDSGGYKKFNMGLSEVYPPFCVLLAGSIGSLIVLCVEVLLKFVTKQLKQQIKPIKPFVK